MVVICELTLNEQEECILYTCIAVATTSEWGNERLYNPVEIRSVIGQMLEEKKPGITKTNKFTNFHPKTLIKALRDPQNATAKKLRERIGKDSGRYLEQVSKLFEQQKRLAGPPRAPATRLVLSTSQPPSAQGNSSGFAEPLSHQYTNPSENPAFLPTSLPQYQNLSNNPTYLQPTTQPYFGSGINPQHSTYSQPGIQQLSPPESYNLHPGSGYQQRLFPGSTPSNTGYQQSTLPPSAQVNPYTQVPAHQAQAGAQAITKIGDDEFDSFTDYLGGRGRRQCTAVLGHDQKYYGAPGGARPTSPHAEENYAAWKEQAIARRNLDASNPPPSSSSSPAGKVDKSKPTQRSRLGDLGGQGKGKKAQGKDKK